MKKIKLTKNKYTIVDADLYKYLNSIKWYAAKMDNLFYAHTTKKQKGVKINISMHRLITNAVSGTYVDHINGNTLDNRIANLRIVTNQENAINSKAQLRTNCGLRKINKKWYVRLKYNQKEMTFSGFNKRYEAKEFRNFLLNFLFEGILCLNK